MGNRRILVTVVLLLTLFTHHSIAAAPPAVNWSPTSFYDDFSGSGIDPERWMVKGDGFSQPGDGFLHFSGTGPVFSELRSPKAFSSGVFTMSLLDYWCNNEAPTGARLGSLIALGLGTSSHFVRIERGQVRSESGRRVVNPGGYVEVNWQTPDEPWIHVEYVSSSITSGFLQMRYDGTTVSFHFRTPGTKTWTRVGPVLTPKWPEPVPLFIQAFPGGNPSDRFVLRCRIDDIEVDLSSPVPVTR
jgi:hypothetical protein